MGPIIISNESFGTLKWLWSLSQTKHANTFHGHCSWLEQSWGRDPELSHRRYKSSSGVLNFLFGAHSSKHGDVTTYLCWRFPLPPLES